MITHRYGNKALFPWGFATPQHSGHLCHIPPKNKFNKIVDGQTVARMIAQDQLKVAKHGDKQISHHKQQVANKTSRLKEYDNDDEHTLDELYYFRSRKLHSENAMGARVAPPSHDRTPP